MIERRKHDKDLISSNQRLEDLEQKMAQYTYAILGVVVVYILFFIVPSFV